LPVVEDFNFDESKFAKGAEPGRTANKNNRFSIKKQLELIKSHQISETADSVRPAKRRICNLALAEDNPYKRSYHKRLRFDSENIILEFLNGVLLVKPGSSLLNKTYDEEDIVVNSLFSKRIILIFNNLVKSKFDFTKYFTNDAMLSISNNIKVSESNQNWICSICSIDSSSDSIGCESCNEWYHFKCLNLRKNFVGSFFCTSCK
jgi:hypothetical protein